MALPFKIEKIRKPRKQRVKKPIKSPIEIARDKFLGMINDQLSLKKSGKKSWVVEVGDKKLLVNGKIQKTCISKFKKKEDSSGSLMDLCISFIQDHLNMYDRLAIKTLPNELQDKIYVERETIIKPASPMTMVIHDIKDINDYFERLFDTDEEMDSFLDS